MKNDENKGEQLIKMAIIAAGILLIGAVGAYLILSRI
jgi:preprotein translocase subunit Sss1